MVIEYFRSWEINATVIGSVTADRKATIRDGDSVEARIPIDILTDPPMYINETNEDPAVKTLRSRDLNQYPDLLPEEATET